MILGPNMILGSYMILESYMLLWSHIILSPAPIAKWRAYLDYLDTFIL